MYLSCRNTHEMIDTSGTPKVSNARKAAARESGKSRSGEAGRTPEQGRLCAAFDGNEASLKETA